jgi:hypothetical protein
MATTLTLQSIVQSMRAYPEVVAVLGASGWSQEPTLTLANDTMQRMLAQGLNWKFNRAYVPPVLTVALQQDYLTQVSDLGWLESADRIDINNSTNNGNLAPKPVFTMESVRDLGRTSYQANPFNVSFIPNSLAYLGQWQANTAYGCGYGVAQIPITPIQQFKDKNGNLLYIDSTVLGLNINSPGFNGSPVVLPTPNPYGTSGGTQPFAATNAPAGTQVTDGTVTWTVADPNGYAIRLAPIPAFSGLAWLVEPIYQKKPPILTSLQQKISPIQDDVAYLFRQGLLAMLYDHAGSKKAGPAYEKWMLDMQTFLKSGDRELDENVFYPSESLSAEGGRSGMPLGPANPYGSNGWC